MKLKVIFDKHPRYHMIMAMKYDAHFGNIICREHTPVKTEAMN